jgi:hypothetical protein
MGTGRATERCQGVHHRGKVYLLIVRKSADEISRHSLSYKYSHLQASYLSCLLAILS